MKQFKLVALILVFMFSYSVAASSSDLEVGKVYRLEISVKDLTKSDGTGNYMAARPSKLTVLDNSNTKNYLIRFISVYDIGIGADTKASSVRVDEAYLLPKIYMNIPTSRITTLSLSGPVSGPLIVPFKYRLEDKDLTGEAAIGYYAGYSVSVPIGNGNRLPITPFISGGLSIISDGSADNESDNKTAFTWAAGLLIQNWANVNIGILYGEDRIGDKTWEYEGDGWISFMVGWDI